MENRNMEKCNVILITIDSLRTDHMSCYGYERKTTPNIDNFAQENILFTNAFANGHNTSTSFPAILSSTYPLMYQDSTSSYSKSLSRERIMIAEILKKNGFLTAAFHSTPLLAKYYGYDRGFDFFQDLGASTVLEDKIARNRTTNNNYLINLRSIMRKILGKNRVMNDLVKTIYNVLFFKQKSLELPYKRAEEINEAIFSWFKNSHKKFFLWVHYMDPHYPYVPPDGYKNRFSSDKIKMQELKKLWEYASMSLNPNEISNKELNKMLDLYDEEIFYLDYNIKLLFDMLKVNKLYDKTMIIITADHGEEFKEHKGFSHWPKFYDELIHIPLIIKLPDMKKGKIVDELVQHIDISPTILGHLKIKKPQNYQGIDILRRSCDVTTSNITNTRGVISETLVKNGRVSKNSKGEMIISYRTKKWKLIIDYEKKSKELYDLAKDPGEKNNIYDENNHIAKTYENILLETAQVKKKKEKFMED